MATKQSKEVGKEAGKETSKEAATKQSSTSTDDTGESTNKENEKKTRARVQKCIAACLDQNPRVEIFDGKKELNAWLAENCEAPKKTELETATFRLKTGGTCEVFIGRRAKSKHTVTLV